MPLDASFCWHFWFLLLTDDIDLLHAYLATYSLWLVHGVICICHFSFTELIICAWEMDDYFHLLKGSPGAVSCLVGSPNLGFELRSSLSPSLHVWGEGLARFIPFSDPTHVGASSTRSTFFIYNYATWYCAGSLLKVVWLLYLFLGNVFFLYNWWDQER